jgi:hypothetical protein
MCLLAARHRWGYGSGDFIGTAIGSALFAGVGGLVRRYFWATRGRVWSPWALLIGAALTVPYIAKHWDETYERELAAACRGTTAKQQLRPLPRGLASRVPTEEEAELLEHSTSSRVRKRLFLRLVTKRGEVVGFLGVTATLNAERGLRRLAEVGPERLGKGVSAPVRVSIHRRSWVRISDGEFYDYFSAAGCYLIVVGAFDAKLARSLAKAFSADS